jgi:hypothetical protein
VGKVLAIIGFLIGLGVVAWLCERYKPGIVLGGILVIVMLLGA